MWKNFLLQLKNLKLGYYAKLNQNGHEDIQLSVILLTTSLMAGTIFAVTITQTYKTLNGMTSPLHLRGKGKLTSLSQVSVK